MSKQIDQYMSSYLINGYYHWFSEVVGQVYITIKVDNIVNGLATSKKDNDNTITYDISMSAVTDLSITDFGICFSAKFGGVSTYLQVPMGDVVVMFAPKCPTLPMIEVAKLYDLSKTLMHSTLPPSSPSPSSPVVKGTKPFKLHLVK